MSSSVFGDKLKLLYPVVESGMSDSGCVDNVLEFLMMAGKKSLPEVKLYFLTRYYVYVFRIVGVRGIWILRFYVPSTCVSFA